VEGDSNDACEATGEECDSLKFLYKGLSRAYRLAGASDQAAAAEAKERALGTHWNRKLPNNGFVLRRLSPTD
jgi:hypothetical protein